MEDLRHECHQQKRVIERAGTERTNLTSLLCLAQFLEPYKLAFHEIFRLVKIALVLPVSSAACERSFSALKLIKTHLRSTMSDSRLGHISILSVKSRRAGADLRGGDRPPKPFQNLALQQMCEHKTDFSSFLYLFFIYI